MRGLSLVAASGGHSSSWCAGLSLSRPLPLWSTGSRRADSAMWLTGLVAPRYVGSSQTRARTHVPCTGRQILNHRTTREAPELSFNWLQPLPFADHSGSLGPYGGLEGARDPAGTEPLSPQEDKALQNWGTAGRLGLPLTLGLSGKWHREVSPAQKQNRVWACSS